MPLSSRKRGVIGLFLAAVLLILACSISVTGQQPAATSAPALDPTKAALEMMATNASIELTRVGATALAQQAQPVTQDVTPEPITPAVSPTEDIEAKIKSANVLLYEDTDELGIGQWIEDAVRGMGLKYTQTGSYSGHFMEYLNSGTKYDLIIVGTENRSKITGEFWDVINTRLGRDKAALIAEIWYLDREAAGPVDKILGPCGLHYRSEYQLAESIYWWEPTHEVFNQPNAVLPLLHYSRYWGSEAGDKLILGGGDATMLAGMSSMPSSGEGVLATCFGGRVIIQTFCNHDYHQSDIISLWQNYIHYTLKNHFLALQ